MTPTYHVNSRYSHGGVKLERAFWDTYITMWNGNETMFINLTIINKSTHGKKEESHNSWYSIIRRQLPTRILYFCRRWVADSSIQIGNYILINSLKTTVYVTSPWVVKYFPSRLAIIFKLIKTRWCGRKYLSITAIWIESYLVGFWLRLIRYSP